MLDVIQRYFWLNQNWFGFLVYITWLHFWCIILAWIQRIYSIVGRNSFMWSYDWCHFSWGIEFQNRHGKESLLKTLLVDRLIELLLNDSIIFGLFFFSNCNGPTVIDIMARQSRISLFLANYRKFSQHLYLGLLWRITIKEASKEQNVSAIKHKTEWIISKRP